MPNIYWTGGTGTWDGTNDLSRWKTTSGGSTGSSPPTSAIADTAIFDNLSGGGTITIGAALNVGSVQFGSFVGTMDFTAGYPINITNTFGPSGTAVRTFKCGATVFSVQNLQFNNVTNLTYEPGTCTYKYVNCTTTGGGVLTHATVAHPKIVIGPATTGIGAPTLQGTFSVDQFEFDTTNKGAILHLSGLNMTLNNSFNWKGRADRPIAIQPGTAAGPWNILLGSGKIGFIEWASITGMSFSGGGTFIAKNCFDGGGNSGITFIAPQSSPIGGM